MYNDINLLLFADHTLDLELSSVFLQFDITDILQRASDKCSIGVTFNDDISCCDTLLV